VTGVEVRVAAHDPSPGKEPDMSQTESVQGLEVRELTPVELNEIAGGLSWFDVLEAACFLSPVCAVGYGAHMLFAE
jgi:hypothetical protein